MREAGDDLADAAQDSSSPRRTGSDTSAPAISERCDNHLTIRRDEVEARVLSGSEHAPARDQGRCDNHLTIRDEVEARVLKALQDKLLNQELFDEFCQGFTREMNRLRTEGRARASCESN